MRAPFLPVDKTHAYLSQWNDGLPLEFVVARCRKRPDAITARLPEAFSEADMECLAHGHICWRCDEVFACSEPLSEFTTEVVCYGEHSQCSKGGKS